MKIFIKKKERNCKVNVAEGGFKAGNFLFLCKQFRVDGKRQLDLYLFTLKDVKFQQYFLQVIFKIKIKKLKPFF